ncbi:hypothetical protein ABW19_dt0202139 [Dactylella cylindrospora]|nr:hypothetical protein ABW19_dt0202139 [Dactylella cylindrospora]
MGTLPTSLGNSLDSSMELDSPEEMSMSQPATAEPKVGLPRRSSTMPIAGTSRKQKHPRNTRKRDSWPAPVVSLKRPAFPRKKLQELQTSTTREEFRRQLTFQEEEKRARSKRMLSLLLPLVKPKEAMKFFPLFTKREVNILTELLEEDKKLAKRLEKVGITLPLDREKVLELAAAGKAAPGADVPDTPTDDVSVSTISTVSVQVDRPREVEPTDDFPAAQDFDKEINRRRETPSHLLPNKKASHRTWRKIVNELDPQFKYITWCKGVWTLELELFNTMDIPNIPLYIADSPVILSYSQPSPQITGQRPPDPLKDRPLPVGTLPNLSNEILDILFKTFPKATMACVFINQRISIVYDHDFDSGVEHMTHPETFGGFRVSFMKNRPAFTAAPNSPQPQRLLTGKRVDVCRPDSDSGWTSCVGVRLRRKKASRDPSEPNDVITMTTHAFLTALRLDPNPQSPDGEDSSEERDSRAGLSTVVTDEDFANLKIFDRHERGEFGQYYQTYDQHRHLRGSIAASKLTHDLCLIKSLEGSREQLPIISFQKKKNQFKKMEWCTSTDILNNTQGKMYLINSWTGADPRNPKDGNIVAEGLVIGEGYQRIREKQKQMYSRSILWRQNFTSKQWQIGQVHGLRERAYRVWNGAPPRRIRLQQHLLIQEGGYSGSPLAVKVNNKSGEESYAIFGFQNYAMRCWKSDDEDDDGYKQSAFGKKRGSVVNQVLMEALDHGAYEFFGSYKLPNKVMEDWDIVYDLEGIIPGVTEAEDTLSVPGKSTDSGSVRILTSEDEDSRQDTLQIDDGDHIKRSSRTRSTLRRGALRRSSSSSSKSSRCTIM